MAIKQGNSNQQANNQQVSEQQITKQQASLLIVYSSHDGQTKQIAAQIAECLTPDIRCDLQNITDCSGIEGYSAVIIGASVRYGHFNPAVMAFVQQHVQALKQKPNAFYSVNLTARKANKNSPQTNSYTRKFLHASPWKPELCAVFAGALRYPGYRWFDRWMIRLIMWLTGGETDTRQEIDYTDWSQVAAFAEQFKQRMTG